MGTSNSKSTTKPNVAKIDKISSIKNVEDFIKSLNFFKGDNGPGDQYVGTFIVEWNKISKTKIKNETAILQGRRFISTNGKYIIVLGTDNKLYVIDKNNKMSFKCFILPIQSIEKLNKIRKAWEKP